MKDTKLMRKNARFRWSSEQGGDLLTLNFRVAAVVNIVIRHCRAGRRCGTHRKISKGATPRRLWEARTLPLWGTHSTKPVVPDFQRIGDGDGGVSPISANRGRGRGSVPAPGQIGDGGLVPVPGQIGDGDGDGPGDGDSDRGVRPLRGERPGTATLGPAPTSPAASSTSRAVRGPLPRFVAASAPFRQDLPP